MNYAKNCMTQVNFSDSVSVYEFEYIKSCLKPYGPNEPYKMLNVTFDEKPIEYVYESYEYSLCEKLIKKIKRMFKKID